MQTISDNIKAILTKIRLNQKMITHQKIPPTPGDILRYQLPDPFLTFKVIMLHVYTTAPYVFSKWFT